MYAIVETGGRQYRVSPGDRIDVEKLAGQVGDAITLTSVLMIGQGAAVTVGTPMVAEARVEARIVAQKRGRKIIIFKYKRRKNYRRKKGHRQWLTSLQITGIHAANDDMAPLADAQVAHNDDVAPLADVPVAQDDDVTPMADEQVVQ
jgi:large subunit ribosomal protein L21